MRKPVIMKASCPDLETYGQLVASANVPFYAVGSMSVRVGDVIDANDGQGRGIVVRVGVPISEAIEWAKALVSGMDLAHAIAHIQRAPQILEVEWD